MDTSKTVQEIRRIATKLVGRSERNATILEKTAQAVETLDSMYNNNIGFDPTQEPMAGMPNEQSMVEPFANPSAAEATEQKIPIESFVHVDEPVMPSDRVVHNCSVVFTAPKDLPESEMMNYILGIGEELGVEVQKFEWEKMEPKQQKINK